VVGRIVRRRRDNTFTGGVIACGLVVLATGVGWLGLAGPAEAAATSLGVSLSSSTIVADGSSTTTATATATNPPVPAPGETITFSSNPAGVDFSPASCPTGPTGTCSTKITSIIAGQFSIIATDTGGTAQPATAPLTVVAAPSTTTLSPTDTAPVTNEVVWLAANVSSSGSIAGTITFYNGATPITGCADKPVSSSAAVWCPATFAVSTPQLSAVYTPGAGSGAATSTGTVSLTVGPDSTSTTLHGPSVVGLGSSATYTATVAPSHSGPYQPTGSVEFFDGGKPIGSCLSQPLASGSASCTVSYQTAASHSISATYSGDGNFSPSTALSSQALIVLPIPGTTTALVAATDHPVTNQDVPLVATVTSSVTPVGTITFKNGVNPINGCTNRPVTTSGAPIICHASFSASTAALTAVFTPGPGAGVVGSTSPTTSLTIGQDSSTVALDVSNPTVNVGKSATYKATVTPNHLGPVQPGGSVEFFDGGKAIGSCRSQQLHNAGGFASATCTVGYQKAGTHSITARYSGDGNFTSASSSAPQQVNVHTLSFAVLGTVTATMQWTFFYTPSYTKILALIMNGAPVGATILVKCHGHGCPYAKQTTLITKPKPCKPKGKHKCPAQHPGTMNLMPRFRNHRLHPGTQVTVEIMRSRWIGKYYVFAVRSRHAPRIQIGCLAAGSTKPGVGC
jgi:large repetitive protein